MADVISRLRLESGEFDSKIKRAGQELIAYSEHCRKMGLEMGYANKDAKDFAKSLGSMQTVSTSARGKINELSEAFVNLKVMYKNMTDEERNNTFGKNLAASLDSLKTRINTAKKDLADVTAELNGKSSAGGGFLSGIGSKMEGALAVFGGNLMTKASEAVVRLGSEMYGMVQQGIEMARAGEGVRIAFERLGRGDILQGLREATHGTVTDLELMKAAVKFNDFKLPVEELGTMLAFAQQKAKDTGQSVDYMVDSIVTGLGRKSLMILDNLGLSATEIRERMKETGDMTKAVGQIIREQMASAGEYVETAADRAAQANVSLQNKMEELGRKFAPVEEASNQLWTSIKIGILDIVGGPLATLLNQMTEAGRLKNAITNMNGGGNGAPTRVDRMISMLGDGQGSRARNTYNQQLKAFDDKIGQQKFRIASLSDNDAITRGLKQKAETELKALQALKSEYISRAKDIMQPVNFTVNTKQAEQNIASLRRQLKELEAQRKKAVKSGDQEQVENLTKQISQVKTNIGYLDPRANKTGSSSKTAQTELQENQAEITKLTQQFVDINAEASRAGKPLTEEQKKQTEEIQKQIEALKQRNGLLGLFAEQAQGRLTRGAGDFQLDGLSNTPGTLLKTPDTAIPSGGLQLDDKAMKAVQKNIDKQMKDVGKIGDEWSGVASAIGAVGNAMAGIEDPAAKVLGIVAQAIASIALGYAQATVQAAKAGPWAWIAFAATGLATMISTISAIHSSTGYAEGGIIKGNSYSGDNLMAMGPNGSLIGLNAGEIVLNKSQQATLAQNLQGGGMQNLNLTATVQGEQIRLALNNNGRRTGRGEYVQSRNVK